MAKKTKASKKPNGNQILLARINSLTNQLHEMDAKRIDQGNVALFWQKESEMWKQKHKSLSKENQQEIMERQWRTGQVEMLWKLLEEKNEQIKFLEFSIISIKKSIEIDSELFGLTLQYERESLVKRAGEVKITLDAVVNQTPFS